MLISFIEALLKQGASSNSTPGQQLSTPSDIEIVIKRTESISKLSTYQALLNELVMYLTANNNYLQENQNFLIKVISAFPKEVLDTNLCNNYINDINQCLEALQKNTTAEGVKKLLDLYKEHGDVIKKIQLQSYAVLQNNALINKKPFIQFFTSIEQAIEIPEQNAMGNKRASGKPLDLSKISSGTERKVKIKPRVSVLSHLLEFEEILQSWSGETSGSKYLGLCNCIVQINKLLKDFSGRDPLLNDYAQSGFLELLRQFSTKVNDYNIKNKTPILNERRIFEECYIDWAKSKNIQYFVKSSDSPGFGQLFKSLKEGVSPKIKMEIVKFTSAVNEMGLNKEVANAFIEKFKDVVLNESPKNKVEELISYCIFVLNFCFSQQEWQETIDEGSPIHIVLGILSHHGNFIKESSPKNANDTLLTVSKIENLGHTDFIFQNLLIKRQVKVAAVYLENTLKEMGMQVEWCRPIDARNFPFVAIKLKGAEPLAIKMILETENLTNSIYAMEKLIRVSPHEMNPLNPVFCLRNFKIEPGNYRFTISRFCDGQEKILQEVAYKSPEEKQKTILKNFQLLLKQAKVLYGYGIFFSDLKVANLLYIKNLQGELQIVVDDYKGFYNYCNEISPVPFDRPALQVTTAYCDDLYEAKQPLNLVLLTQRLLGNCLYEMCIGEQVKVDDSTGKNIYDYQHPVFKGSTGAALKSLIEDLLEPKQIKKSAVELYEHLEEKISPLMNLETTTKKRSKSVFESKMTFSSQINNSNTNATSSRGDQGQGSNQKEVKGNF